MTNTANYKMLIAGLALLLLNLVLGGIIPLFTNPRLALSAHEQGIIAGGFIMLLGLVWPYTSFKIIKSGTTSLILLCGIY